MESSIKRLSRNAVMLACALILGYIEHVLPLQAVIPLPGVKLGLPNLVILLTWFYLGPKDAVLITTLRVGLQSLLFGSFTSFFFSFSGAVLSILILFCFGKIIRPFSLIGLSVLCAAAHQLGQIMAASLLFQTIDLFFTYLPWLLICGMVSGTLTGILADRILKLLQKMSLNDHGKDSL